MLTKDNNTDYTLISAYIDDECTSEETNEVHKLLDSDTDFRTMYEIEKAFTTGFRRTAKRGIPSADIIQKINEGIENETERMKAAISSRNSKRNSAYRYFLPIAAVLLIFIGYFIFTNRNSQVMDFVNESRNLFDRIEKNEIKLQHVTSNASELQSLLTNSAGYNVFVPDVRDAELVGGTVNEMNHANVVHIVHRNNGRIIYTMQMSKSDLIGSDKLVLNKSHKNEITEGHNWIECEKNNSDCTVIWYKNDVICSSVSKLGAREIATVLTNYK